MANIEKRVAKSGKVSYRVKVRIKGYPVQSETFPNITMARNWGMRMEARIQEGLHLTATESKKHTLSELISIYKMRVLAIHQTNAKDTERYLNTWDAKLGAYALASLTPALIINARDQIANETQTKKARTNATINRYMAALSVVLSYAVRELEWLENNPVFKISKLPEPRGRVRYLSDTERENLLTAVKNAKNPYLYPVVLLGMTAGARKMEILGLKWADVNFSTKRAILHDTKNKERRSMPLAEPALSELKKLFSNRTNSEYVFPAQNKMQPFDITRSWRKAMADANLVNFHFHDLRHTCASYLAMNGATMGEIAAVLGHKTLQMTKRYAHLSEEHSQIVVEKMTAKIFGEQ